MNVDEGILKLQQQLPLEKRQAELSGQLIKLHQYILRCFAEQGRPPSYDEMQKILNGEAIDAALKRLQQQDLVILDEVQCCVVGAYPFTLETTSHEVTVNRHKLFAMCALDALSIAPMFSIAVEIHSRCAITNKSITIKMVGINITSVEPRESIYVGINWRTPQGHAAYSLCTRMVFIIGEEAVRHWQALNATASVFNLDDAVAVGEGFFSPLLRCNN